MAAALLMIGAKQRRLNFAFAALLFSVLITGVGCGSSTAANPASGSNSPGAVSGEVQSVDVGIIINGTTVNVPNLTITVQ
jgi:hypothetical protein